MAFRGSQTYGQDPAQIIEMAMDPSVPAAAVMAAAQFRSRTGRLVQNVQKILSERGPDLAEGAEALGILA